MYLSTYTGCVINLKVLILMQISPSGQIFIERLIYFVIDLIFTETLKETPGANKVLTTNSMPHKAFYTMAHRTKTIENNLKR